MINVVVDRNTAGPGVPMRQWDLAPAAYDGGHSARSRGELEVWEFRDNERGLQAALHHRDQAKAADSSRDWAVVSVDRATLDRELLQRTRDEMAEADARAAEAGKVADPYATSVYILRNPGAYGLTREGDGMVMTLGQLRGMLGEAARRARAAGRPLSR